MSVLPTISVLPTSSYNSVTTPLSRDGVAIAVIDSALDTTKIPKNGVLSGTVRDVKRDGTVRIDTDAGPLTARLPDRVTATPGQPVRIELAQHNDTQLVPRLATLSDNSPPPETPTSTPPSPAAPPPRPTDIYTPSPRTTAPTPAISTPPAVPIDILAQAATPSKYIPGTTITAQSVSLPDVANILARAVQTPVPLTTLPSFIQTPPSVLTDGANALIFFNLKNFNLQTLFGTSPFSLIPNNSESIFPGALSLAAPQFPQAPGSPLTIGLLQPARTVPLPALQITLNTIQAALIPTLSAPGTGPLQATTGALFGGPAPHHFSTSLAQGFMILNSTTQNQTIIGTTPLYGNALTDFFTAQTRGSGWPAGSVFTAQTAALPQPIPSLTSATALLSLFGPLDDIIADLSALNLNVPGMPPIRMALPSLAAPQNFGTSIFLFLAAMQSGDLNGFLGDAAINAFKRSGRGDRLEKLDGLLQRLKSALSPATNDWKSFMIPVQTEATILPVMMHVKSPLENHPNQNDSDADDHSKKLGKRVIIDMTFDRMGAVQVDMHLPHQTNRLDTILRTEMPLSRTMQDTIARLYAGATAKTRLTGEILFQGDPKKWVTITPEQIQEIKMSV